MKMPCKCHRFWSRICYISYRMQLWSTALCILLTTQVEALLTRHLAVCTSGRRSVEIANRESLRWTVFSRWEKSTPAASDIAIRWGLQKSWISENFTRFFSWVCMGLWGLQFLCCSYLTMVWQPYVSEPWLRTLWGATVFGWHLASPDGDVLAYTNLTYATLTSRFGVPHVSFGWWWMVDNLPTFYLFQQVSPFQKRIGF